MVGPLRYACYRAYQQLVALTGKTYGVVGWFVFSVTRNLCLEMFDPECTVCPIDLLCAHRKFLFQPVIRTSYY